MYGCHESCDEKTAIQVHPRHFNTELLSSVRLISGCHVVANQTTLATNLPCQRRASGSAANFPRSDVRAHSVSSVNELHPNDIVSRSRHLKVTNHSSAVYLSYTRSRGDNHLHIKTPIYERNMSQD